MPPPPPPSKPPGVQYLVEQAQVVQLEVRHDAHVLLDQPGVCISVAGFLSAQGGGERNGALEHAASHERNRNCTVEGTVSC